MGKHPVVTVVLAILAIHAFIPSAAICETDTGHYPNGKIKYSFEMSNGKRNGPWKWFYENGKLQAKGAFKDGKREGFLKSFHPNGVLAEEEHYVAGNLEGTNKTYFENGRLRRESTYKDDKTQGPFKAYYENGQLHFQGNYESGKMQGTLKAFYKNGALKAEATYVNDKWNGPSKEFYKNGATLSQATFVNGNGEEKRFYETGEFKEIVNYKNNDLHGSALGYYRDGTPHFRDLYLKDQILYRTSFDSEGKKKFSQWYCDGVLEFCRVALGEDKSEKGEIKREYYDDGFLKRKWRFKNDLLHGECATYYQDGLFQNRDVYDNGRHVRRRKYNPDGKLEFDVTYGTSNIEKALLALSSL